METTFTGEEKLRLASVGDLERKNIRKFAKRGIPVTIVDWVVTGHAENRLDVSTEQKEMASSNAD